MLINLGEWIECTDETTGNKTWQPGKTSNIFFIQGMPADEKDESTLEYEDGEKSDNRIEVVRIRDIARGGSVRPDGNLRQELYADKEAIHDERGPNEAFGINHKDTDTKKAGQIEISRCGLSLCLCVFVVNNGCDMPRSPYSERRIVSAPRRR